MGRHRRATAVRTGQATTGRVIIAAATIMICVFSAFILSGQQITGEFGLGLAGAVLLDAFLLRTLLVPALMHLAGRGVRGSMADDGLSFERTTTRECASISREKVPSPPSTKRPLGAHRDRGGPLEGLTSALAPGTAKHPVFPALSGLPFAE